MLYPILPLYKFGEKIIISSKDCIVTDSEGKTYIDFESGDWAANLGHSNDRVNNALKKQAEVLIHDGLRFRNQPSEELAAKLLEKLCFADGQSVFLNSGSEAVNLGIILARNLTGRDKILKIDCSYLACYGLGQASAKNTNLFNIPFNNIEALKYINFEEIAAFVFEPGNSGGMVRFPEEKFITAVVDKINEHGGLLMANEVTTGFGRTGKWFGYQYYNFKPDIVSMGKALGNGYPVSCVCVNNKVAGMFESAPFRYAQSHQNDPLGCAVGLEVIKTFEEEYIIEQAFEKGRYFIELLQDLQKKHFKVKEIRGRGLMIAVEFFSDIYTENMYHRLIDKGFLVGQKEDVIRLMPPITIKQKQMVQLVEAMDRIMKEEE